MADWRFLEPLDRASARFFTQRAAAVRAIRASVGPETPIIVTAFSPLTEAFYGVPDRETFLRHVESDAAAVHGGLRAIAENLRASFAQVIEAGADGVFFSVQDASTSVLGEAQFREFGRPYDFMALEGAANGWLNTLHVHGERDLRFDWILDYPVQVLSWSDRLAGPTLAEARRLTDKCLMGGWNERGALATGPAEAIRAEAEDAVAQTGGRKLILANGCSVPDDTDERWLRLGRQAADELAATGRS